MKLLDSAAGAALLVLALALPSCDQEKRGGEGGKQATASPQALVTGAPDGSEVEAEYAKGLERSLFKGTTMEGCAPDSIAFSRDLSRIFAHGYNASSGQYYAESYSLSAGSLAPGLLKYAAADILVPRITVEPKGREAIVQAQWQPEPKHVRDVLWRVGPEVMAVSGDRSGVPYDRAAGMPSDGPYDTWENLAPCYSWDGQQVVVPLHHLGLCIVDVRSGAGSFVPYPTLEFDFSQVSVGALPDEEGARRIWVCFGAKGVQADRSSVQVLDLTTLAWELAFSLRWLPVEFGVSRVFEEPWLVAGTRPAGEELEGQSPAPIDPGPPGPRVPRLALVVPRAQTQDILPLHGVPAGNVAVESRGKYFAYMDQQRKALVRCEAATGKLDVDPSWYCSHPEARVYCGEDGEHVLCWRRSILFQAEWQNSEDLQGYLE